MIKIAITNEKGGTGKSTIACLLVEYLNHLKKKVQLITTTTWFTSLKPDWQAKIIFIPNHWQNTREQRQGLAELKEVIAEEKQGKITPPLFNRPALYGALLNGSKNNFFSRKGLPSEIKELFKEILTYEKTN